MSWQNQTEVWNLVTALIISTVSGFISISRKILQGHTCSILWVISEFLTAVLCGYLMYHAYPHLQPDLLQYQPIATAVAAHTGGRIFQEAEHIFIDKYIKFLKISK